MHHPTLEELNRAVEAGHVRRRVHPTLRLEQYTYTESCVYGHHWDPVTLLCRGLVVESGSGRVVAWPFPKFFNYEEHVNGGHGLVSVPNEPFEVFDKIDGSLGIVFHYADRWHVATKGSFVSDQAQWAQRWLDRHDTGELLPGTTYLAEITYPENRIVVGYPEHSGGLTLLGAYNAAGEELSLSLVRVDWEALGGAVVDSYGSSWKLSSIVASAADNRHFAVNNVPLRGSDAEGWVVRFASGLRMKIKLADYIRLHGVVTRTNARTLWEALSTGTDPAGLLQTVPDEFSEWMRERIDALQQERIRYQAEAWKDFQKIRPLGEDRKEFALAAQASPYRPALFRLLDGRGTEELAWKAVRPEPTDPDYLPPSMRSPEETE